MQTGTVVKFERSFGFIKPDGAAEGERDLFVHWQNIVEEDISEYWAYLKAGERVTFETEQTPKGLQAVKVSVIEDQAEVATI